MKMPKLSSGKIGISCTLRLPLAVAKGVDGFGDELVAGILGEKAINVLAAKKPPHVVLANLREEGVFKFVRDWGPLLATKEYQLSSSDARTRFQFGTTYDEAVHELLKDQPQAQLLFSQPERLVIHYRDLLRMAWNWNPDKKVASTKAARALAAAQAQAFEEIKQQASSIDSTWSFKNGCVEIGVPDLWKAICVLFLNDRGWDKAAICERMDECPARYFHRPKTNQRFCGGDCKRWARLEVKRRWWSRNKETQ